MNVLDGFTRMPIDREQFESAPSDELVVTTDSIEETILEFLAFTPDTAYTRREIRSEIDTTVFSVATGLSNLEEEGYVQRKGSYWLITERGLEATSL